MPRSHIATIFSNQRLFMASLISTTYSARMDRDSDSNIPAAPDPIALLIRSRRLGREWSLARLAAEARLRSPAYVFHIENGSKAPSVAVARRLAMALGLE